MMFRIRDLKVRLDRDDVEKQLDEIELREKLQEVLDILKVYEDWGPLETKLKQLESEAIDKLLAGAGEDAVLRERVRLLRYITQGLRKELEDERNRLVELLQEEEV
jgi:hypothetical protein